MISVYGIYDNDHIVYAGQTTRGKHRFEGHHVKKNYPNSVFRVIATTLSQTNADNLERGIVRSYDLINNGENKSTGGKKNSNFKMSKEGRDKISNGLKGKPKTKEHVANMSTKFKKGSIPWSKLNADKMKPNEGSFALGKPFNILKDGKVISSYEVQSECAKDYNIQQAKISSCLKGERKSHKGYTFKYRS